MKTINEMEQLTLLDPEYITIKGDQLALEDRRTGKVYITTKPHINKLFNDMGYRSLTVVNILKEFAGKIISNVGDLKTVNIYADEIENSCVIATENAIKWTSDLATFFNENGFTLLQSNSWDTCRSLDEYVVKSPNGTYFAVDIDLVYEQATVYSLNDIDTSVKIMPEGTFYLTEECSIEDIKSTFLSKIDLSSSFSTSVPLSVDEYANFLAGLGLIKKGRRSSWYITELGEEDVLSGVTPNIDQTIEAINELSWIKAHTVSSGVTLDDIGKVLAYKFDTIMVNKFAKYYFDNSMEKSDYYLTR